MDYINSQEKKIAHDVVYKIPELQDSCWISKFPHTGHKSAGVCYV